MKPGPVIRGFQTRSTDRMPSEYPQPPQSPHPSPGVQPAGSGSWPQVLDRGKLSHLSPNLPCLLSTIGSPCPTFEGLASLPVVQGGETRRIGSEEQPACSGSEPTPPGVFQRSPLLSLASGARFFGCLAGHVVRGEPAVRLRQVAPGTFNGLLATAKAPRHPHSVEHPRRYNYLVPA